MSIRETLKSAGYRYARRMAVRVAFGGAAALVGGLHAFGGAAASEPAAEPAREPAARAAARVVARADSVEPAAAPGGTPSPADSARAAAPAVDGARTAATPVVTAPTDSNSALAALGRETFVYGGRGRRDPFASLLKAGGDLRPQLSDLRLVTVLVGADGRNSVAIMRDLTTKEQYRRRAGESLGRMRVASIQPRQVVFTIEEFGYSRQEVLMYSDSTTTRTK